jgi:hypothetical protein
VCVALLLVVGSSCVVIFIARKITMESGAGGEGAEFVSKQEDRIEV